MPALISLKLRGLFASFAGGREFCVTHGDTSGSELLIEARGGSCSVLKFGELSVFSEGNNSKASQLLSDATNRPLVCGAARRARQLDGKRPVDSRNCRGAKFLGLKRVYCGAVESLLTGSNSSPAPARLL